MYTGRIKFKTQYGKIQKFELKQSCVTKRVPNNLILNNRESLEPFQKISQNKKQNTYYNL